MSTWFLLFRGINVGGKHILPMKELVLHLESLKLNDVKTYIQSGNVVFTSSKNISAALTGKITALIQKHHGFAPHVFLLSSEELEGAIASNPFPQAEVEPTTVHLCFLDSKPTAPDIASLNKLKTSTERFHLKGRVFYLHTPDGIARSKLASSIEKFLGVSVTARNWRTVRNLSELAK